jgi:hypothetical protein
LTALAGSLSGHKDLWEEALGVARVIGDVRDRSSALAALAGSLSGDEQRAVLQEALGAARLIEGYLDRSRTLLELFNSTSEVVLRDCVGELSSDITLLEPDILRALAARIPSVAVLFAGNWLDALSRGLRGWLLRGVGALTPVLGDAEAIKEIVAAIRETSSEWP